MTLKQPTEKQIQKWVEALRSGKYYQTNGTLNTPTGYCCLGVACNEFIHPKDLSHRENTDLLSGLLPSDQPNTPKWLEYINDDFKSKAGALLSGLNDNGVVQSLHLSLTDGKISRHVERFTFDEIADILELTYIHKAFA